MTRIISSTKQILTGQRGVVLVLVALLLFVLLGFAAFAIDFGYSYVVRNELQNAADAAALAGASVLFQGNQNCLSPGSPYSCCTGSGTGSCDPSVIDNVNVSMTAQAVAGMNNSGGNPVPAPTVEIGHYAFASSPGTPGTFTAALTYTQMTDWQIQSFSVLNGRTDFINAVRATVSRTDVPRFFSRIWSSADLTITAQAVAYVGFAGQLMPGEVDLPISICKQSIELNNNYSCNRGRMINSGNNSGNETGGWTNYDQPEPPATGPCDQPTKNDIPISKTSCAGSNSSSITLGLGMGLTNGMIETTYDGLLKCWVTKNGGTVEEKGEGGNFDILTWPDRIWKATLPVVDCDPDKDGTVNVSNCSPVVGAVTVNIVWMTRTGTNSYDNVPTKMDDWTCPAGYTNQQCWENFVNRFNLKRSLANDPATFYDKTIYFQPDCEPHIPVGNTGGENFGILARHPVLVH